MKLLKVMTYSREEDDYSGESLDAPCPTVIVLDAISDVEQVLFASKKCNVIGMRGTESYYLVLEDDMPFERIVALLESA